MSVMNIVTACIVILIMAVLSVVAIRFGYKALLIEWAIDAISKAEKEFVGTKLGEARLAVVVSWLREKVPAPIRFLVTDDLIRKAVQTSFNKYPVTDYSQCVYFMRKTGLFDLMGNHLVNNLVDYVTGVETGLDSNGRKNRGGHLMENLVEGFIKKAGFIRNETYFKEMYIHQITEKWGIDLSAISNQGKMEKRFDFVVKTPGMIYGVETNFYGSGGSKLNETARSYKTLALETDTIEGLTFVWFTDGKGWTSARHNLEETFDVMQHIYSINDMENGIINEVFI